MVNLTLKFSDDAIYLYYSGEFIPPVFNTQGSEGMMFVPQVELHLVKVPDVQDISSIGMDYKEGRCAPSAHYPS